jgi:hypothetical protein
MLWTFPLVEFVVPQGCDGLQPPETKQRLAQLRKYRLAIEAIAACYPVSAHSKAASSIAASYRNRSHSAFLFCAEPLHPEYRYQQQEEQACLRA